MKRIDSVLPIWIWGNGMILPKGKKVSCLKDSSISIAKQRTLKWAGSCRRDLNGSPPPVLMRRSWGCSALVHKDLSGARPRADTQRASVDWATEHRATVRASRWCNHKAVMGEAVRSLCCLIQEHRKGGRGAVCLEAASFDAFWASSPHLFPVELGLKCWHPSCLFLSLFILI